MNITKGNTNDTGTNDTGWFIGFSDWTRTGGGNLLHIPKDQPLSGLCVKWFDHPTGDTSGEKPVSEGKTISILVSTGSSFRLQFSTTPAFEPGTVETVLLQRQGDFVAWGAGIHHRWSCETRVTILTIRWNEPAS